MLGMPITTQPEKEATTKIGRLFREGNIKGQEQFEKAKRIMQCQF